jgi:hypothetical protein
MTAAKWFIGAITSGARLVARIRRRVAPSTVSPKRRKNTWDIQPFEYEANLDGDFSFIGEEWSLADSSGIMSENFDTWELALDCYIGHLKKFGRIVSVTEEEYEAYCLEQARARGEWWFERYQDYLAEKKGVVTSV